ncbi:MAG: hypothetical protein ABIY51_11695 [Ferruginibacter sp.]
MNIISSRMHGIIDYLLILFLVASPTLFKMEGALCSITYTLAAVHLLLTILTNFELGLVKLIPFRIHGLLELVVAIVLGCLSFWFYKNANVTGFYFYMFLAIAIMIVFILTDFKSSPANVKNVN